MKERSIIFNAPMVRALLDGTKTQTRRAAPIVDLNIKPYKEDLVTWGVSFSRPVKGVIGSYSGGKLSNEQAQRIIASQFCNFCKPGDRLWVREAWMRVDHDVEPYRYRATNPSYSGKWKPSIHMPRSASRITLEIVGVRVERLQDISEADCIAEGAPGGHGAIPGYAYSATPKEHYQHIWESINGAGAWAANPWVWCIDYRRLP